MLKLRCIKPTLVIRVPAEAMVVSPSSTPNCASMKSPQMIMILQDLSFRENNPWPQNYPLNLLIHLKIILNSHPHNHPKCAKARVVGEAKTEEGNGHKDEQSRFPTVFLAVQGC